ncbi:hypothetical protein TRV_02938 [Trichophyton verrucosum HKI 0517]|uniref:Uncharacterized protein n=1 Tax=Trichophyton verrucosum (strain HKI 0517) TaxID=663202 RepID=D4D759_TRIVH|nr:uncharacterized protein TRV_02938 [Trichophyton verrucosum HKI 0517]EFE42333.1 hypothetical protein TRV_02938 [Trichophyton verrucosum HKI 0517]
MQDISMIGPDQGALLKDWMPIFKKQPRRQGSQFLGPQGEEKDEEERSRRRSKYKLLSWKKQGEKKSKLVVCPAWPSYGAMPLTSQQSMP